MNEFLVTEHLADLRRDAIAHPRAAARADRAEARLVKRATYALHRRPSVVGCCA